MFCLTLFRALQLRFAAFFRFYVVFKRPGVAVTEIVGKETQTSIPRRAHASGTGKGQKSQTYRALQGFTKRDPEEKTIQGKILIQGNILQCKGLIGNRAGEAGLVYLFFFFTFSHFLLLF